LKGRRKVPNSQPSANSILPTLGPNNPKNNNPIPIRRRGIREERIGPPEEVKLIKEAQ